MDVSDDRRQRHFDTNRIAIHSLVFTRRATLACRRYNAGMAAPLRAEEGSALAPYNDLRQCGTIDCCTHGLLLSHPGRRLSNHATPGLGGRRKTWRDEACISAYKGIGGKEHMIPNALIYGCVLHVADGTC